MKIAFISFDFGEYCIQHANGLLADGDVMLLLPENLLKPHADLLDPNVDLRTFDKPRLRQPLRQLACVRWIFRQIHKFKPDVVHFQRGHLWFNLALPFLKRYPLVVTIHDPRHHVGDRGSQKTPQRVMDFGYRQADQVIVHGNQLKEVVVSEIGLAEDRIHVIPHVAIGIREPVSEVEPDDQTILFFGRIWLYKGLDFLIRAQPIINYELPNAKIVICGRGDDFERYRKLMHHPERFEVHNRWITDQERVEFFQRASVVVLPYIEATQSGVVPIAYAHRKPVIATRTGGLPEVVEDGITGLLVTPGDEIELAQAIIRLLSNPALRVAMGNAGHKKLETELSPATIARQTANVYRTAISNFSARASTARDTKSTQLNSNG